MNILQIPQPVGRCKRYIYKADFDETVPSLIYGGTDNIYYDREVKVISNIFNNSRNINLTKALVQPEVLDRIERPLQIKYLIDLDHFKFSDDPIRDQLIRKTLKKMKNRKTLFLSNTRNNQKSILIN